MIYTVYFEVLKVNLNEEVILDEEAVLATCFESAYCSSELVLKQFRDFCAKTFPKIEIAVHRLTKEKEWSIDIDTVIGTPHYHYTANYNSLYLGWHKDIQMVVSVFYSDGRLVGSTWKTYAERNFSPSYALFGKYTTYHPDFPLRANREEVNTLLEKIKRLSLVETAMCNTELATRSLQLATDLDWQYSSSFAPMQIGDTGQMKRPGGLEWWVELKGEPKRCKMRLTWLPRGGAELTEVSLFGGGSMEYSIEGVFELEVIII